MLMKDQPQTAQISYNICFHQTHMHYSQYLLTLYVLVLSLSLGKKCRLRECFTISSYYE